MELKDPEYLSYLMRRTRTSQREVSAAAGWKSHTWLGKLLRGDVRTLEPHHAAAIAAFFGARPDVVEDAAGVMQRLFTPRASIVPAMPRQKSRQGAA